MNSLDPIIQELNKKDKEENQIKKVAGEITKFDFRELAREFLEKQPLIYDISGAWYFWNDKKKSYIPIDEIDLMNQLDAALIENYQQLDTLRSSVKEMLLEAIRRKSRMQQPKEFNKSWVQFGVKIYDWKEKKIIESSPEYFSVNVIPWEIGTNKDTPTIDKLFSQWVGEKEVITLKEYVAFCCVQGYPLHRIIYLLGRGMNGKGVFLRFLIRFIGVRNVTSTTFERLLKSNFEVAKLHRKLVCIISETNFGVLKDTALLKQLTGEDLISGENKGKDPFDFVNPSKLITGSNSLPVTHDRTDGFYRRVKVSEFPNQFEEGKDPLSEIPEEEYAALAAQILDLLPSLIERGRFTHDGDIDQRRRIYEEKSNPLGKFMGEFYEQSVNSDIPLWQMREEYKDYCRLQGHRELTDRGFSEGLALLGFEVEKLTREQKTQRWVINIIKKVEIKKNDTNDANTTTLTPYIEKEKLSQNSVISGISVISDDDIITLIINSSGNNNGQLIIDNLKAAGMEDKEIQNSLDRLSTKGLIYSPRPDHWEVL